MFTDVYSYGVCVLVVGDSEDSGSAAADGTQQAKMVGSVTPFDILQAVKNQLGIQLDPSHLLMDRQITTFGTHKVGAARVGLVTMHEASRIGMSRDAPSTFVTLMLSFTLNVGVWLT